jgi:hypothetical protein
MKHSIIAIICFFTSSLVLAQKKEWKQMDDFHTVMSKSYHPVEEGKFQPLMENAGMLVQKAIAWQASAVPNGYNVKEVKPKLKKLVSDCRAVQAAVKQKKSNEDLKAMITTAHNTFHEIMEGGEHQGGN